MLRSPPLYAALCLLALGCDDTEEMTVDAMVEIDAHPDGSPCQPVDARPPPPDGAPDGALHDGAVPDGAPPDAAIPDAAPPPPDAALVWVPRRILTEADGLLGPDGLYAIDDHRVLLANEVGGEVLEIDVDGPTVSVRVPAGGGLRAPEEVAIGPDGAIYISDDAARSVFRVVGDQIERLLSAADGLESPEGIAVAPDGTLFVADEKAHILVRRDPDGTLTTIADEDDGVFAPEGLALGADGTLYATDDRRGGVLAVDPDGTPRVFLGRDVLALPEAVAVTANGELWFTDNGSGAATLQRFTPRGEHCETVEMPVPAGQLAGIAVLPDGRLVVSVFRSREVHELWLVTRE